MIRRNCTRRCSEKLALNFLWTGPVSFVFSSVQSLSCIRLFVTPWTSAHQASLSITNSRSLPRPMSIESVMPSNHLILRRSLLLLPSIFPSTRVFSNESALRIRWPKYWSFSFRINPSNEHPGLISFRMDWFCFTSIQNQFWGTKLLKGKCFLFLVLLNWWGHYLWHTIQDIKCTFQVSISQFSRSVMSDSLRPPWIAARQASLSITNSQNLLRLMSIKLVMPSNHFILCCPLFLPPSIFPSIRVFSNESVLHIRWPKYWSFSFSISEAEYSGRISFRTDWLDLLAVYISSIVWGLHMQWHCR